MQLLELIDDMKLSSGPTTCEPKSHDYRQSIPIEQLPRGSRRARILNVFAAPNCLSPVTLASANRILPGTDKARSQAAGAASGLDKTERGAHCRSVSARQEK